MNRPNAALPLVAAISDLGLDVQTDYGSDDITIEYGDGSTRVVECDTFELAASEGRASIIARWCVNPDTGRWKQLGVMLVLLTGTETEDRLADVMGTLPRHVRWSMPLRRVVGYLERVVPSTYEGSIERMLQEWAR